MNAGSPGSRTGTLATYAIVLAIVALVVGLDATGYLPGGGSGSIETGTDCLSTPYLSQNRTASFYIPIRALLASPASSSDIYLGTFFGLIVGINSSTFSYRWVYVNQERIDMTGLIIDPHPPYRLYTYGHPVTNVDTGIRLSCDGGQSWSILVTRPDPHQWVVSESNSSTMYATDYPTNVLVRSDDGGRSWSVLPSPSAVFAISVNPENSHKVLVGTDRGLFLSTDGGKSWDSFAQAGIRGNVSAVSYDPMDSGVIYVGTTLGLMKTTDGGLVWTNISSGLLPKDVVWYISVSHLNTKVLFAASVAHVYKSVDGGTSWKLILG